MPRLLLLLAFLLTATTTHAQTWEWLYPGTTANSTYDVFAFGEDTIYASASFGTILSSTDGGATLKRTEVPSSGQRAHTFFLNPQVGWTHTDAGEIFKTTDSGQTWTLQYTAPEGFWIRTLHFSDALHGWAGGNRSFIEGILLRTTDGGETWETVDYPVRPDQRYEGFLAVQGVSADSVYAFNSALVAYRSVDGGATWDTTHVPPIPGSYFEGAHFADDGLHGWAVGPNLSVVHTADAGRTWTQQLGSADSTDFARHYLVGVHFLDDKQGWATAGSCLYRTTDGGAQWDQVCDAYGRFRKEAAHLVSPTLGYVAGSEGVWKTVDGGNTFTNITAAPFTATLYSAHFFDSGTAVAVGSSGTILRTSDGWQTFEERPSSVAGNLYDVGFSGTAGWTVGNDGAILHTSDAGLSWSAQTSGTTNPLRATAALDPETAVAVGDGPTILKTTDGGATWSPRPSGASVDINDIHFIDAMHGWAVGDTGYVAVTVDAGENWTVQPTGVLLNLNAVHFTDANNGWAVGGYTSGLILHTSDGGETWLQQPVNSPRAFAEVFFADAEHGWASQFGSLYRTSNGGATWQQDLLVGTTLNHLQFSDAGNGWAFGGKTSILKFGGVSTSIEVDTPHVANRLAVYPNPTQDRATISVSLESPGEIDLIVYDVLGRRVHRQRELLSVEEQRLSWAVQPELASGLYLIEVKTADGERLGTAPLTVLH